MKVQFIQSGVSIGLGYQIGAIAEFSDAKGLELIETGFAIAVEEIKVADEVKPVQVKKAIKKK